MARSGRGGRGGRGNRGNQSTGAQHARPARGRRSGELPTAAPGAAGAPLGASTFGSGNITIPQPRMPAERPRGGPQGRVRTDRRARVAAAMHDFRYVGADLRWIALTTVVSVGLVLALWAVTRL